MIGSRLGNYRILEEIGSGGMGTVYRAVDEMLDREIAIKVLRPDLARQSALLARFRQEAIALARLNHPNIATLFGLERHGDDMLMLMEYVRGETLESVVQRTGRISWQRSVELCIGILQALDHAHDKGVVHRDIKPANVMLGANGDVKVMDFGIARVMGRNRQTQFGHAVGTPTYMAPEQLRGEEVDGRTDLYAVGAVLFELVTGRMAFEADSDYSLMLKQLNEPPPPLREYVTSAPPALEQIVLRAMEKDAARRFPSANAFRRAMTALSVDVVAPPERTPGETRFAAPSAPSSSPIAASSSPPATRLASEGGALAPTRVASPAESRVPIDLIAAIARGRAVRLPAWTQDWRSWIVAAVILVSVAVTLRALRHTPATSGEDVVDATVSADTPAAPGSLGDTAGRAPAPEPALATGAGDVGSPSFPGVGGDPVRLPRAEGSAPLPIDMRTPAPRSGVVPAPSARTPIATTPPAPPSTPERSKDSDSSQPPAPDRDVRPNDLTLAREAVASAIIAFARAASTQRVEDVRAVLRGDPETVSAWLALMREGRVAMSVQGEPDIDLREARATAAFSASLNVRTPFGANRRRTGAFVAELTRVGSGWRVTSIRVEKLDLK